MDYSQENRTAIMNIIVTGGAGFIGSNFVIKQIQNKKNCILNLDKLTYAGNLNSLTDVKDSELYSFKLTDICDGEKISQILSDFKPDAIVNFAAESHVDRSIDGPMEFIQTNVVGTSVLLKESLDYFKSLSEEKKQQFRFLHVSTDEVFGSLGDDDLFTETTPYDPSSPYSASKAASDHLVRAWYRTFGLPVIITNCSNNYGPNQFPEKLVPLMILNAIEDKPLPVYGSGKNVRDWLYVEDHCEALYLVLKSGKLGETYNIGGNCEKRNIEVVQEICDCLDTINPKQNGESYSAQITYVKDRPGHDFRYAINTAKIKRDLNWQPEVNFSDGISKTIKWYIENAEWWQAIQNGTYNQERLGLTI